MASLLQMQLENAQERHATLLRTDREDAVALIVLYKMREEIRTLKERIKHEEKPRKEVVTCASACAITRHIRQGVNQYGAKCYGDNHTIPAILTCSTC